MSKETKEWWDHSSRYYQEECRIPVDIHYGPGSPNEKQLGLLGNVKNKRVLELGCGGAQCSIAFAEQGAIVTGIDISGEQLKFAKALAEQHHVTITFYQGDIKELPRIDSDSQDIVFSAFALLYVDDLLSCFKEVFRVLKETGLFVFSTDHPCYRTADPDSLKLKSSYFKTGKVVTTFEDPTKKFVMYTHTMSELYNTLRESGLTVERIIEPDSRKRYAHDPWYGLWDYTPRLMNILPPTIIFKCRKAAEKKG
jgi:ubiquinone/menaquinone biosynthesis C-methylase UbiE